MRGSARADGKSVRTTEPTPHGSVASIVHRSDDAGKHSRNRRPPQPFTDDSFASSATDWMEVIAAVAL